MKQLLCATGMLCLFAINQVSAQKNETAFLTRTSIMNSPLIPAPEKTTADVNVSIAAAERFAKDYKHAKNVEWSIVATGYRAYFIDDGILTAVDYTQKGTYYSTIRYGKYVLPKDILHELDMKFQQPIVLEASEVKIAGFSSKAYVVVVDDKASVSTVRFIDGEMQIITEERK